MKTLLLVPLFILSFVVSAEACFAPSPEQTALWQELVKRTDTVVLVEVLSAKPLTKAEITSDEGNTVYKLKVLEALKGQSAKTLNLTGVVKGEKSSEDFKTHAEDRFWQAPVGRTIVSPDCSIKPSFSVGEHYLVFLEKPYHVKSFEKISGRRDLWLQKVKAEITALSEKK